MCGINGIFGVEHIQSPEQVIEAMNKAISHRGPDAHGKYVDHLVALGHVRLSILDLSNAANQPMHSANTRYVIVYNGEVYNFRQLRRLLDKQYNFSTQSDTEVLLAAYEAWGVDMISRLEGMFAFAIFDRQEKTLFIGRDRLGIKPLYYSFQGDKLLFSSEIRGLLASNMVARVASSEAILEYLHYQTVHAPATILRDVEMLMPGHFLLLSEEGIGQPQAYWKLGAQSTRDLQGADLYGLVKQTVKKAVEKRLIADVPFGAFLSGGIDSSIIVSQMAELMSQPVNTFTITFDEESHSEAKYAKMVSDRYATKHTEIKLQPNDLLKILPDAFEALDHPSGDGANTFLISKVTKQAGVSMVLSGLGGDELFAGYPVFRQLADLHSRQWLMSFPKVIRNVAAKALVNFKQGAQSHKYYDVLLSDYLNLQHIYPLSRKLISAYQFNQYFKHKKSYINQQILDLDADFGFGGQAYRMPYLSKISYAEISTYMQNVLLRDTDQMSMAHALEVRVPFLDHDLVQLALSAHDGAKLGQGSKPLLVNSFKDELIPEIVNRPKMGFTFPWDSWMRTALKPMIDERVHALNNRQIFKPNGVNQFYLAFQQNKVSWSRIWHLVVLESYLAKHAIEVE